MVFSQVTIFNSDCEFMLIKSTFHNRCVYPHERDTTVTGLVAGTKYWFRVAIIISKGKNDYTDPHIVHVV